MAKDMIEIVLDSVFQKFYLDQLERTKAPFATSFTKEYFRKALK